MNRINEVLEAKGIKQTWLAEQLTALRRHRHLNYGEAESADLDHFIEWIFSNDKQIEASTDYNKG